MLQDSSAHSGPLLHCSDPIEWLYLEQRNLRWQQESVQLLRCHSWRRGRRAAALLHGGAAHLHRLSRGGAGEGVGGAGAGAAGAKSEAALKWLSACLIGCPCRAEAPGACKSALVTLFGP